MSTPVEDDTIVAVITPPGEGGVAGLRLAGPDSLNLLTRHFKPVSKTKAKPFLMKYGSFDSDAGESLDMVMAVFMPEGKSYTGCQQVEIFCHGGRQVVRKILNELINSGARAAEPGEFTKLAFLAGQIDLSKAEAVAEIIKASTERSYKVSREHLLGAYSEHINELREKLISILTEIEASIDFSEVEERSYNKVQLVDKLEDTSKSLCLLRDSYKSGRLINEGFQIAIAGRPNAGKSSLFNYMLRQERAIVNPIAGTTRDYLSEWLDMGGFAVNLIDTAGIRADGEETEKLGQEKAEEILSKADLILWLVDISEVDWLNKLTEDLKDRSESNILLIGNKIDLVNKFNKTIFDNKGIKILISCKEEHGISELHQMLISQVEKRIPDYTSGLVVTSARHQQKISGAFKGCNKTIELLQSGETPDIIIFELRQAINHLDEITGRIYNEEILDSIFSTFCIGK